MATRTTSEPGRCVCPRGDVNNHCQIHGLEAAARRIGRSLAEKYGGPFDIVLAMLAGKLYPHEQEYVAERLTPAMVALASAYQSKKNAHIVANAIEEAGYTVGSAIVSAAQISASMAWQLR